MIAGGRALHRRVRRSVGAAGFCLVALVGVVAPVSLGGQAYLAEADRVALQAERSADAVGAYIFRNPALWWLHTERLESLLSRTAHLPETARAELRRDGAVVAARITGAARSGALQGPILTRCADVATAAKTRLCVAVSATRLAYGAAGLAGGSLLVALALYWALAARPMRLLDEAVDRLETAAHRAQAADIAKSEFLATMSHEIRTPLNGVLGMAELLSGTRLDDRQKLFAETIQTSGKALLATINDILDFSKIDAGQMKLLREDFKLADLASGPAQMLALQAREKGIELTVRVAVDLPRIVRGDFARLRQVMVNLVGNAVKFSDHGEVHVEIAADPHAPETAGEIALRFSVRDAGWGVPSDKLPFIFERFTQVDQSSTRKGQGTGLGLAISKGLVEVMGGRIGVDSVVDEGSTFWFTLSLPVSARNDDAPAATAMAPVAGRRALVIDDNETNRMIFAELLDAWRIRGEDASSGREGLRKLQAAAARGRPFDLVLLDHHMPGFSGLDVLAAMRAAPELARTPVIMLSSIDALDEIRADDRPDRPLALVKPVPRSDLFDAIVATLHEADSRAARPQDDAAPAPAKTDEPRPRALIVDDNEINRMVAGMTLEGAGFDCAFAENGAQAVELVAQERFGVVLMDISMPVMNGLDATREIRRREGVEGRAPVFVIGLTAHAMEGDRERCLEVGMDSYLPKPFVAADLQAAALAAARGGVESPAAEVA